MKKNFWIVVDNIIRKADVILEVLDARMPSITRNTQLEQEIAKYGRQLIIVINKTDLIGKDAMQILKSEFSGTKHIFCSCKEFTGVGMLIGLIKRSMNKEQIKVAVIGYPNTGKSSIINLLSRGGRAKTSSESGLTKGIQLINGKSGLLLFDTPGVVPFDSRDEIKLDRKSVV